MNWVEGTTQTRTGTKVSTATTETTGLAAKTETLSAETVEDWSMILQKGLWDLLDWQQLCCPSIFAMEQWVILAAPIPAVFLHMPQGVRATRTPKVRTIRLKRRIIFFMVLVYT
jgi:hypothetical protein